MSEHAALIVMGDGFEEIEAVTPIDLLRRAGIRCVVASCEPGRLMLTGRTQIVMQADCCLTQAEGPFDAVVVPGGPGVKQLRKNTTLLELLRMYDRNQRIIGAICAAPLVLSDAGVLKERQFTGHVSVKAELPALDETQQTVVDGHVVTSRGAGTAVSFGLALVRQLAGSDAAQAVAQAIHYRE